MIGYVYMLCKLIPSQVYKHFSEPLMSGTQGHTISQKHGEDMLHWSWLCWWPDHGSDRLQVPIHRGGRR